MKKEQIALKLMEKLIEHDIDFSYTGVGTTVNDTLAVGCEDLGEIVIKDGSAYFDEWDTEFPITKDEDLFELLTGD